MYLKNIYPTPRTISENSAERFTFGASAEAVVSGLENHHIQRIKALWNRFSCTASELNVLPGTDGFRFVIGNASALPEEGDSYAIHADAAGVCVTGKDAASLMDGIKTLMQLICPAGNRAEKSRSTSCPERDTDRWEMSIMCGSSFPV